MGSEMCIRDRSMDIIHRYNPSISSIDSIHGYDPWEPMGGTMGSQGGYHGCPMSRIPKPPGPQGTLGPLGPLGLLGPWASWTPGPHGTPGNPGVRVHGFVHEPYHSWSLLRSAHPPRRGLTKFQENFVSSILEILGFGIAFRRSRHRTVDPRSMGILSRF